MGDAEGRAKVCQSAKDGEFIPFPEPGLLYRRQRGFDRPVAGMLVQPLGGAPVFLAGQATGTLH